MDHWPRDYIRVSIILVHVRFAWAVPQTCLVTLRKMSSIINGVQYENSTIIIRNITIKKNRTQTMAGHIARCSSNRHVEGLLFVLLLITASRIV